MDQSSYKETIRKLLFEDPWSPWQRGTNGLILEYLPKRTDMTPVSEEYIKSVVNKVNNKPKKMPRLKKTFRGILRKTSKTN